MLGTVETCGAGRCSDVGDAVPVIQVCLKRADMQLGSVTLQADNWGVQ